MQKRNIKTNIRLVVFPFFLCLLLVLIQTLVNNELDKPSNRCGCTCVDTGRNGQCERRCGIEYSTLDQVFTCSIPHPPPLPPLLQIPSQQYRAVRTDFILNGDLPDDSCKRIGSCPVTMLITGDNQTFGQSVAGNMFARPLSIDLSDILYSLADDALGSETKTRYTNYLDPAFSSNVPVDFLQSQCTSNSQFSVPIQFGSATFQQDVRCVQGLQLWRNSSTEINDELYKGYRKGNAERKINEIVAAYDFMNSNENLLNVTIWYNSTYKNDTGNQPLALTRVPRSVNLVVLTSLVYEKQHRLRIMMKMHGLGDGPYWMISYAYFLAISSVYMLCFVIFGSAIGLKFFTLNDYSIQFVFYFLYINLQISLAFLVADLFSNVKTATVVGYMMVFGTGLLGGFLFQFFLQDSSFPKAGIIAMELYPGFSLYRGLYEFSQYSFNGNYMGTDGMRWKDLNDSDNGMREVFIIIAVEWLVVLGVAYYADQVVSSGRSPLFFLRRHQKNFSSSFRKPSLRRQGSKVFVQMEKLDVQQEREKVEQLLLESSTSHAIVCDNLKKIYPGKDGNPEKFAVRELSLALPQGECFGMLGPNGAGKTSFINMMIGLTKPSSGTAYVQGLDIRTHMDRIYTSMGVCPQHDLLWETLTGKEHLLFYGRLKNLKGASLTQAVEESLKSVNLFHGGVADKQAGKYSGGMKRRLSVAISLIGDPKVVYMDEPSTGLDPASRNMLWNVVKRAKQNRAIILTSNLFALFCTITYLLLLSMTHERR
ncbi:UNVERIFIED_CONTAM: ABC transporter A family member 7 [Sesamum calycinum]|uniref:ABC transporter A family member 7 n=1 Tax=Sesamum calycinum TaxID=2727403 RepID=A0AAW2NG57_9LAMI